VREDVQEGSGNRGSLAVRGGVVRWRVVAVCLGRVVYFPDSKFFLVITLLIFNKVTYFLNLIGVL